MFSLTEEPIPVDNHAAILGTDEDGAYVAFEGRVRNHHEGREVLALAYEAYPELAVKEGTRICEEAKAKFAVTAVECVHRTGDLEIGEVAVWVGATAHHREAAFDACRYVIDEVKARVPIWKHEYYADGTSAWVNCGHSHE